MAMMALGVAIGATVSGASGADSEHVAGLIVDYGDGAITYAWVPFPEDQISGVDLLEMSGLPVLTVGFGGMGDAVCKIVTTGCDVSPCRQRLCQTADLNSPYWHYLRLGPDGTWTLRPLGGSSSDVTDGVIDAWVWAGSDSMPRLPVLTMPALAERAGATTANPVHAFYRTTGGTGDFAGEAPSSTTEYVLASLVLVALAGSGSLIAWRSSRRRRSVSS